MNLFVEDELFQYYQYFVEFLITQAKHKVSSVGV